MLSGVVEEHCADVDEVSRIGMSGSSEEAKGNSAILSILGALTETSGDSTLPSGPTWGLYGVCTAEALVKNGREALRADWKDCLAGECDTGSCNHKNKVQLISNLHISPPTKLSKLINNLTELLATSV